MTINPNQIKEEYQNILVDLKPCFDNVVFYEKHVLSSSIYKIDENNIFILVHNVFVKEVLEDYKESFADCFAKKLNATFNIFFITEEDKSFKTILKPIEKNNNSSKLDKNQTFENYVIGVFNENAVKAIKLLLENPIQWQSLFIYGTTGLGKTHLLNAMGNEFLKLNPDKVVLYLQIDDFFRNLYNAISIGPNEVEKFKDSFNDVDLLLVDDIQFLSNKDKTNEVFFTIYNRLIKNKKTVVMTSDKIPNVLKIEDRMISRFNSGLQIKINKPDLESVKKIIVSKINSSQRNNQFSKSAIDFLSTKFNSDIRVLEGIINKIIFYSMTNLNNAEIINDQVIKEIIKNDSEFEFIVNNSSINPELIIESVCLNYGIDASSVVSKKRNKEFSFVRKICMYILREKLAYSYNQIGSLFSNRNHSTVLESIKDVENKMNTDEVFKNFIIDLMNKL